MKEFWYTDIEDYLKMSDVHDNPKTIKLCGTYPEEQAGKKLFKAVTYLRTALMGYRKVINATEVSDIITKCKAHGHSQGLMLETGRFM